MKLSDAIALGRLVVTPKPGQRIDYGMGACALGMADKALGQHSNTVHKWLGFPMIALPCGCTGHIYSQTCEGVIAHLFDFHVFGAQDWTLDELIDWVRSVEPPELADKPEPTFADGFNQLNRALNALTVAAERKR